MEREIEERMVDEIRASSEAYENLLVLADDIGIRLAGTSNEIAARDFLVEKLKQYGLDKVRTEAFQHQDSLADAVLMINNDVGGRPKSLSVPGFEELKPVLDPAAERVQRAGEDLEPFQVEVGGPSWGSDHFPFMAHGVPTVGISTEPLRPEDRLYGHTRADTPDKVYPEGLKECAVISAQVAAHVANLPSRPVPRRSRQEMEEMIRAPIVHMDLPPHPFSRRPTISCPANRS